MAWIDGTDRDVAQRQGVARLDVGARAGLDPCRPATACRRDDVALLAVGVVQQRDARGAVRVVLDVRDLGRHAVLVVATEVDQPVGALVAATLVAGRDPAVVVAAALVVQRARPATSPASSRVISTKSATLEPRRPGVVGLYLRIPMASSSFSLVGSRSGDRTAEDVDAVAVDAGVTIARLMSLRLPKPNAGALALALAVERVDVGDLDAEHLLDRDLDLGLVGVRVRRGTCTCSRRAGRSSSPRSPERAGRRAGRRSSLVRARSTARSSVAGDGLGALARRRAGEERLERALGEHDVVADQHVVGVELVGDEQVHALDVAQALPGQLVVALERRRARCVAVADAAASVGERGLGRRRVAVDEAGDARARGRRGPGRTGRRAARRPSSSWACAGRSCAACGPWTTPPPANCGARVEP